MEITGTITGITYKPIFVDGLQQVDIDEFDINTAPSTCLLKKRNSLFAISKWVSPKRTRSYPFERVYNSLGISKKITVIPVVKDEGAKGDRDYIQWDTVSLMSLLDVYVIFGYYNKADISSRNPRKITNQQFDNKYIFSKIKEVEDYHSSALHWNLNEIGSNFYNIINKTKSAYTQIQKETGVLLHNVSGIDNFKERIGKDVSKFMQFSREKAQQAQEREFVTIQPKESLSTHSKAKITITNYLGGQYFFTVDEIEIIGETVYLIEAKHSRNSVLPSKGDIKDGLLKMILYSNLRDVKIDEKEINSTPALLLTSPHLEGSISSLDNEEAQREYFKANSFSESQTMMIKTVLLEAKQNNFILKLQYSQ